MHGETVKFMFFFFVSVRVYVNILVSWTNDDLSLGSKIVAV